MRYDYKKDKCKCPKCKNVGFVWAGYFTCDTCGSKFLVETGEEVEVYDWINGEGKVRLKKGGINYGCR